MGTEREEDEEEDDEEEEDRERTTLFSIVFVIVMMFFRRIDGYINSLFPICYFASLQCARLREDPLESDHVLLAGRQSAASQCASLLGAFVRFLFRFGFVSA